MHGSDEMLVAAIGLGVAAFGLAAMAIASASVQESLRRHVLRVRAMELRNEYLATVHSIHGMTVEIVEPEPISMPGPGGQDPVPASAPGRAAA